VVDALIESVHVGHGKVQISWKIWRGSLIVLVYHVIKQIYLRNANGTIFKSIFILQLRQVI
jgi:hypothetical protein